MKIAGVFRYLAGAWLAALLLVAAPLVAQTPDAESLFQDFDARGLQPSEKRILQSALAFQGFYNGLLDGKWGRGSQAAIERYALERFDTEPWNIHMATLAIDFAQMREDQGWQLVWRPVQMVSLAIPTASLSMRDKDGVKIWDGPAGDLSVGIAQGGVETAFEINRMIEARAARPSDIYRVRAEGRLVTSTRDADGTSFYARSERIGGLWTSVMVFADPARKNEANGIAASISFGAPTDWVHPADGLLRRTVALTLKVLEDAQDPEVAAAAEDPDAGASSGTGFYVSAGGQVLTNAHVVTGCTQMKAGERMFRIAAVDARGDLALLAPQTRFTPPAIADFAAGPARLNADLTVVGYPLHGILGGLNVTRGALTSASGLGGDSTTMQISAPVQPGNSGGPVIDASGLVTGVVVSKLDAIKIAGAIGDLPQNVNFAIRGEVAKLFLAVHGVNFRVGIPRGRLDPSELAEQAARYTVLLECR